MEIELVSLGLIHSVVTALAIGCVVVARLTANNFKNSTNRSSNDSSTIRNGAIIPSASEISDKKAPRHQVDWSTELLASIKGNNRLLSELRLRDELAPSLLVDGARLSLTAANVGFSNLELVIRTLLNRHNGTLPFLFGINRGGGLLANLLSQRLALDQKYLVRCDYRSKWNRVICEPRSKVDFAIILDDAVRSGETISTVAEHLKETYPKAKFYVLALVVSAADTESDASRLRKLFELVDYYPWISRSNHTMLPWSDGVSEDATHYIEEDGVDQVVARLLFHGEMPPQAKSKAVTITR